MPRRRRGAAQAVLSRAANARRGRSHDASVPSNRHQDNGLSSKHGISHLSKKDGPQNTECHNTCNSDLKLRHAQVNFVTAARVEEVNCNSPPDDGPHPHDCLMSAKAWAEDIVPDKSMAKMSLANSLKDGSCDRLDHKPNHEPRDDYQDSNPALANVGDSHDTFFMDTMGSGQLVQTGLPLPVVPRFPSPSMSDSSGEIIVFSGRKHLSMNAADSNITSASRTGVENLLVITTDRGEAVNDRVYDQFSDDTNQSQTTAQNDYTPLSNNQHPTKGFYSPLRRSRRHLRNRSRDEDLLADYIASMDKDNNPNEVTYPISNEHSLGGVKTSEWQVDINELSSDENLKGIIQESSSWAREDLHDLDDLSTSDEMFGAVDQILSKRKRPAGIQYLVVWEGHVTEDARWIPLSSLTMASTKEQIRLYEVEVKLMEEVPLRSVVTSVISDGEERLKMEVKEKVQNFKGEEDLLGRKRVRMTHEQIARMLSKQEELGLGSEDLLIFDSGEEEDMSDDVQVRPLRGRGRRHTRIYAHKTKRPENVFGLTSTIANAFDQDLYDSLDLMDQERPSLPKKAKGHHRVLPFQKSNVEAQISLNSAWANDRTKKKKRKQQRDELRTQGLLGKRNKLDMKARYPQGMSIEEVKNEIRNFLVSSKESLPLAPMDKKDRKIVHEIANIFALKSRSIGGGRCRYPVLYKTLRTSPWNENEVCEIDRCLNSRRFLPRMDTMEKRGQVQVRRGAGRRGGGFAEAAVSYRDGEVVGAAAPELGTDNRGRAMLVKMGWSTGTALGAMNNKGIMQPVAHVVKNTKAGLG